MTRDEVIEQNSETWKVAGEQARERALRVLEEVLNDLLNAVRRLAGLTPVERRAVKDAAFEYESGGIGSVMVGLRLGLSGHLDRQRIYRR